MTSPSPSTSARAARPVRPLLDLAGLGSRLRTTREQAELPLEAVASRAGITASELTQFESGAALPTLGQLALLADATGVPAELLVASA